jgi:MTH538 TIR-like domain (DUF1863).
MFGKARKTRDIFITHAWRYHEDWNRLSSILDSHNHRAWRNFSLPWYDPALSPATESGGAQLRWNLESQIVPVDVVLLLSSVFAQQGSRKWIDFEIEIAKKHSKPIIAIPFWGEITVLPDIARIADLSGTWEVTKLLESIDELSAAPPDPGEAEGRGPIDSGAPIERTAT